MQPVVSNLDQRRIWKVMPPCVSNLNYRYTWVGIRYELTPDPPVWGEVFAMGLEGIRRTSQVGSKT